MSRQTPIAILSVITIGLLEGIDPYKRLLFSYYFFKFRKAMNSLSSSYYHYMLLFLKSYFIGYLDTTLLIC
ncbi:hypothetical protein CM19_00950 [Candidatus Acidianus copahuensis]|uniref:Uncharacterized protein n=1 Tax=Candidatus Acidianus copahuensis TaxID=1160895 RepID=A0A031LSP1_9CREN|nr:hypothetical protein CM19_00950 [Candidatus Acidianus copahuensis]